MTNNLLLPNMYKRIGWVILIPATILGLILAFNEFGAGWIWAKVFAIANKGTELHYQYFVLRYTNITNTVIGSLFIIGALLVSFSQEKNEDEFKVFVLCMLFLNNSSISRGAKLDECEDVKFLIIIIISVI